MTSMNNQTDQDQNHDDFGGFSRDLSSLSRRKLFGLLGGVGTFAVLSACSDSESNAGTTTSTTTNSQAPSPTTSATSTNSLEASPGVEIPNETQGPFPADGSNGPNVLKDGAAVRKNITSSFGDYNGIAAGVATKIRLQIVDAQTGTALQNLGVYAWHCTADGRYSIYEVSDQNYLRGMQSTDELGVATFETIFPGCYRGRWPHVHFEIFSSTADAENGSSALKVSQLAIPEAACSQAYADGAYLSSVSSLAAQTLARDNVFTDGWKEQLATATGSNSQGWEISLLVRI